jgi:hypothetical protein
MNKLFLTFMAIAVTHITLGGCDNPKTATSPKPEATATSEVVNQREAAAKQQSNKLEQKRTQVQQSVMQSEQQVNEAEKQAK